MHALEDHSTSLQQHSNPGPSCCEVTMLTTFKVHSTYCFKHILLVVCTMLFGSGRIRPLPGGRLRNNVVEATGCPCPCPHGQSKWKTSFTLVVGKSWVFCKSREKAVLMIFYPWHLTPKSRKRFVSYIVFGDLTNKYLSSASYLNVTVVWNELGCPVIKDFPFLQKKVITGWCTQLSQMCEDESFL